jgi:hypothetical protein
MRVFKGALLACAMVVTAAAQSQDPPIGDTRLTVHTLLREDVFAGFLDNNAERFARADRNLDALLTQRPDQRANLLAWKAGMNLYRAVRAHEAGNAADFARFFKEAKDGFAEAARLATGDNNDGVAPITGGSYSVFADRLPQDYRAAAWQQAYESYSVLWKAQGAQIDKMPVHFQGEVLGGMAQSAQRTGRTAESAQFVDRMLTLLAETPFEKTARQWKDNPASAASTNLTCKNCHAAGRLSARLRALQENK